MRHEVRVLLADHRTFIVGRFITVVLTVSGIAPLGAILRDRDGKSEEGDRGTKQHKVGENAQPLHDH